jgi:DNA-binding XRE family transcriptional regulator
MNQVERFRDDLARKFPRLPILMTEPVQPDGSWWLDVGREGAASPIVVEWRPSRGFGVSTPDPEGHDYGLGPDEVYPGLSDAFDRVVALIESGGRTEPPATVCLAELRQTRGMTQEELAAKAGVKQANISRLENRGDVLVSTLARVLAAMGASLSIRARFPDGMERELEF